MSSDHKKESSFTKRHSEAMRIRQKYPDRIPIYVTKNPSVKIYQIFKIKNI